MWQATLREIPGSGAVKAGSAVSHTASANAHRVRKRQPEGGSIGLGGSPKSGASIVRWSGSIDGIADSNARV